MKITKTDQQVHTRRAEINCRDLVEWLNESRLEDGQVVSIEIEDGSVLSGAVSVDDAAVLMIVTLEWGE